MFKEEVPAPKDDSHSGVGEKEYSGVGSVIDEQVWDRFCEVRQNIPVTGKLRKKLCVWQCLEDLMFPGLEK